MYNLQWNERRFDNESRQGGWDQQERDHNERRTRETSTGHQGASPGQTER